MYSIYKRIQTSHGSERLLPYISLRLKHVHIPQAPLLLRPFPHKVDASHLVEPLVYMRRLVVVFVPPESRGREERPLRLILGRIDRSIHIVMAGELYRAEKVEKADRDFECFCESDPVCPGGSVPVRVVDDDGLAAFDQELSTRDAPVPGLEYVLVDMLVPLRQEVATEEGRLAGCR